MKTTKGIDMLLKLTQRQTNALNRKWVKGCGGGIIAEPRIRGTASGYLRIMYLTPFEFTRINHIVYVLKKRREKQ